MAGSGKTTVGRALAGALGWRFYDADDLHSVEAIASMRNGVPLDDRQRQPWLLRVRAVIEDAIHDGAGAVVACSALKAAYRRTLTEGLHGIRVVFLTADPEVLRGRLAERSGHFAGPDLLESQLAALEPPVDALTLDAAVSVDQLVGAITHDWRTRRC